MEVGSGLASYPEGPGYEASSGHEEYSDTAAGLKRNSNFDWCVVHD